MAETEDSDNNWLEEAPSKQEQRLTKAAKQLEDLIDLRVYLGKDPRRYKYIAGMAMGMTKLKAAQLAGYSSPPSDANRFMRKAWRITYSLMEDQGVTLQEVARRNKQLLDKEDIRMTKSGDLVHTGQPDTAAVTAASKLFMQIHQLAVNESLKEAEENPHEDENGETVVSWEG